MALERLRGCEDGKSCPALYRTDDGRILVQGDTVDDPTLLAELGFPPGESGVFVPASLLQDLPLSAFVPAPLVEEVPARAADQ